MTLEAFGEEDWRFILGVTDERVRRQFEANEAPFRPEVTAKRAALDAFTASIFDAYRPGARVSAGPRGETSGGVPQMGLADARAPFSPASLARCWAFLLGTHPRAGASSLIQRLPAVALRRVIAETRD